MKTKSLFQIAVVALFALLDQQFSNVLAQGSLTPPGAPGPTMKSLAQVEPRTAITNSGPVTISQSGSYYLTTNITVTSSTNNNGVTISANNVSLDLSGFTISSTITSASGTAIFLNGTLTNITIVNGLISSGITNNGATNYGSGGFGFGIYCVSTNLVNVRVADVSVSGCYYYGIFLIGKGTLVKSCLVNDIGSYGIYADGVLDSIATGCGNNALTAITSASNCRGISYAGAGVTATVANNCVGQSATGTGVNANDATSCYGTSTNSYGVSALSVNNCYGASVNSYGIVASYAAINSVGAASGSGVGLYSAGVVTGCYGYASTGTGISAEVATSSFGVNANNSVSESVIYKNSMP